MSNLEAKTEPTRSQLSTQRTEIEPGSDVQVTVIQAQPGWKALNFRELWKFRELLFFLTWRDVKVRYKQSLLGAAWAVIQPLMYMVVFTIVFGRMANAPSDGFPYPLFSYSGLVLWTFFAGSITQAGNSVVGSGSLLTKVYLPRLAIPFASVGAGLFDFFVSFSVLIVMIAGYKWFVPEAVAGVVMGWQVLLVPLLVFLGLLGALGVGTILAALNVAYRDFKHTIPFLVQLWMFATPAIYMGTQRTAESVTPQASSAEYNGSEAEIADADRRLLSNESSAKDTSSTEYSASSEDSSTTEDSADQGAVRDEIQFFLKFNPMTGLVRSFRAAILGQAIPWTHLGYSTVTIVATFFVGCFYFHRVENSFADII